LPDVAWSGCQGNTRGTGVKIRVSRLDAAFARRIKERDGRCRKCGRTGRLECAHIISRRVRELRWDERNALSLCFTDHRWAHENPLAFVDWLKSEIGAARLRRLKQIAAAPKKVRDTRKRIEIREVRA